MFVDFLLGWDRVMLINKKPETWGIYNFAAQANWSILDIQKHSIYTAKKYVHQNVPCVTIPLWH